MQSNSGCARTAVARISRSMTLDLAYLSRTYHTCLTGSGAVRTQVMVKDPASALPSFANWSLLKGAKLQRNATRKVA